MKLKSVFIIFNAIVVLTFLIVFLMPLFFLGFEFALVFWRGHWYLAALFVLVLAVLNGYFLWNWRLFSALEAENWKDIATVMEDRIGKRGCFSNSNVRLLVNAYIVTSRTEAIRALERLVRDKKPRLLSRHVMLFSIPHLVSNNGKEIEEYFASFRSELPVGPAASRSGFPGRLFSLGDPPLDVEYWVEWGYAFGLLLQGRLEEGQKALDAVSESAPPGVVKAVSLYLLDAYRGTATSPDEEILQRRDAFIRRMPLSSWRKRLDRERTRLHVIVLGKLLNDVEQWLYGTSGTSGTSDTPGTPAQPGNPVVP
jgi:hypothetical protein